MTLESKVLSWKYAFAHTVGAWVRGGWPRLFVGLGGHFVFGRGFSWVWVGISCLAEHFVGIVGHFVFGRGFS